MKYCLKCGSRCVDQAVYCARCGAKLYADAAKTMDTKASVIQSMVRLQRQILRNKRLVTIGIIAAVVLLCYIAGAKNKITGRWTSKEADPESLHIGSVLDLGEGYRQICDIEFFKDGTFIINKDSGRYEDNGTYEFLHDKGKIRLNFDNLEMMYLDYKIRLLGRRKLELYDGESRVVFVRY